MGGAERLVLEEVQDLSRDFDVKITVVQMPGSGHSRLRGLPLADLRELLFGRYDLIHTHLFLPGLIARIRRIWDGSFTWVHTVHYHHYEALSLPRLRRRLDGWAFRSADRLIAVSEAVRDFLADAPGVVCIDNAVDLSPVPAPPASSLPPVVGCVAMLRAEKGLADFVAAAALLRDRGVDARYCVAGDGPLRDRLTRQIRALDLEDRFELRGYVEDVAAFYRSLAVYVQPSLHESFGLAVLDALRFNRPVVATAVGNLPAALGDGAFGILVPRSHETATSLADGIQKALGARDELAERAEAGRLHWQERLAPSARAERQARVYREALGARVCFVSPIITQGGGGIPRQVAIQSRALAAAGHGISLVQRTDPGRRADEQKVDAWRHLRIWETPDLLSSLGPSRTAERFRGALFTVFALARLVVERHLYDVVHAQQLYSPTLVGALAKVVTGKPLVVRVTASGALGEMRELRRLPFRRLRAWAFRRVDRVVVLTETMRRDMLALGFPQDRVVSIPNAVELPPEPLPAPRAGEGPFRLVYTGRLSTEKSLKTLIEAAALLAQDGHRVEVSLVGGPAVSRDATPTLREAADQLPNGASVRFVGAVPDVTPALAEADAFVLPSVSEGMSNALLEAMAHGMVCLASDIPENRAVVVHGESGLLFKQGDARSLAGEITALIRDQASGGHRAATLREGARQRIRTTFSPERVVADLEELYAAVMASGRR